MRLLPLFAVAFLATAAATVGCRSVVNSTLFQPTHEAGSGVLSPWVDGGETIGFVRPAAEPRSVWLLLHGNAGQAVDRVYAMPAFSDHDAVYILEYPGYGERHGRPSRSSIDAAARHAYGLLRADHPGVPVCVAAESLGSGPAAMLAAEPPPPDKIVFVVPFDDLRSVASEYVGSFSARLLATGLWNNVQSLRGYCGAVEVFGAEQDRIIPVDHARTLAASLPQARFHLIRGGHNDWSRSPDVRFLCPQ